jgi:hypothetical protein
LYLTEYANLNSQSLFNAQLDVNGYKQGGLGNGVTILPVDDAMQFNKKYPFIPCGYTDSLGNNSGEIPYDVDINGDGSKIAPVYANRFRGIENIFGHIFKFIDGFAGVSNEDNEFIKAYVSDNPANFANFNTNNYRFCGNIPYMEGFVKELMFGEYGEIVPVVFGGGSTVYFCDQFLTAYDNPNERYLWVGGDSTSGTSVGLFYFLNRFGGGNNSFVGGTRLCFIPE